ncbi:MAG: hypothetical protein K2N48_10915 [Muribaculaceae bacterium]|nr:hypothetical protein [Muribaculaceae bacterium]
MRLQFGTLLLAAIAASTMSAQTPTAVQDIYSQTGEAELQGGATVVYSFGSWHSGETTGDVSLWGPLFDQMLDGSTNAVEGVYADANGVSISWNSVDKLLTVTCEAGKLGRTTVLVAETNGATRGAETINESPAQVSLSNYAPGVYVVAVAVDGKLIKSLKITLK